MIPTTKTAQGAAGDVEPLSTVPQG